MTLAERYPVCYEKMAKVIEKLYRCELIQDKDTKDTCLKDFPNNEPITLEPWCDNFIQEINTNDCSKKYYKDTNGSRVFKCVLDKLWYQPTN